MTNPDPDLLRSRVGGARRRLQQAIESGTNAELRDAAEEVESLSALLKEHLRLRRTALSVAVVAVLALLAGVTTLVHLREAVVSIAAETSELHVELASHGPTTGQRAPLLEGVEAIAITVDRIDAYEAYCVSNSQITDLDRCRAAKRLVLTFSPDFGSKLRITSDGANCLWIRIDAGSATIDFVASLETGSPASPIVRDLAGGDRVRVCGQDPIRAWAQHPQALVFGQRSGNRPEYAPALAEGGQVEFPGVGRRVELSRTEVFGVSEILRDGVLAIVCQERLLVSFSGTARRASYISAVSTDAMPTVFSWIQGSPLIRAVSALIAALVGFVWALRERLGWH